MARELVTEVVRLQVQRRYSQETGPPRAPPGFDLWPLERRQAARVWSASHMC